MDTGDTGKGKVVKVGKMYTIVNSQPRSIGTFYGNDTNLMTASSLHCAVVSMYYHRYMWEFYWNAHSGRDSEDIRNYCSDICFKELKLVKDAEARIRELMTVGNK